MIAKKGEFYSGAGMMGVFVVVLVVIFMPIFNGHNGLNYLDALYNSISKGSAYYIPAMQEEAQPFAGTSVKVDLVMADETQARQSSLLFQKGGALVNVNGPNLAVDGDLGKILAVCLSDADLMYHNNGSDVAAKYGYGERQVLDGVIIGDALQVAVDLLLEPEVVELGKGITHSALDNLVAVLSATREPFPERID